MKVFAFPKQRHVRTLSPPSFSDYRQFKPFLQREFSRRCIYCRVPDTLRTAGSFGADHYRPKSKFPAFVASYKNLFYACNQCNLRKGTYWPTGARDPFIPNPCDHVMHEHLRFGSDESVKGVTVHGRLAAARLDLSEPDMVNFRTVIETSAKIIASKLKEARTQQKRLRKFARQGKPLPQLAADLAILDDEVKRLEGHLEVLLGTVAV